MAGCEIGSDHLGCRRKSQSGFFDQEPARKVQGLPSPADHDDVPEYLSSFGISYTCRSLLQELAEKFNVVTDGRTFSGD
jgi:hypothetical protein